MPQMQDNMNFNQMQQQQQQMQVQDNMNFNQMQQQRAMGNMGNNQMNPVSILLPASSDISVIISSIFNFR